MSAYARFVHVECPVCLTVDHYRREDCLCPCCDKVGVPVLECGHIAVVSEYVTRVT